MKIAVIGSGRMGAIRAEDLLGDGAEVTIFNRRDLAAEELAKKLGCGSGKYSEVYSQTFDGYVVATATNAHVEILCRLVVQARPQWPAHRFD